MRELLMASVFAFALALPSSVAAEHSHLQGFGGFTFGDVTSSTTFGGNIALPLSDHLQIVGEGGRMTDLMPSLVGTFLDLTPVDLRVSAWYGEGGLRFIAAPQSAFSPYIETTGGFARMRTGVRGTGSTTEAIINTGLGFFGETEPLLGVGAGVLVQGGPLVLDLGYRYKKIFASDSVNGLLTGGDVHVNQLRIGAGVRF